MGAHLAVRARGITKCFGDVVALDGIDLDVGYRAARVRPAWTVPDGTAAARARFVADGDGPKEVNGYFLVRTPTGDAPNPLWQFDGAVDLLPTTPKG